MLKGILECKLENKFRINCYFVSVPWFCLILEGLNLIAVLPLFLLWHPNISTAMAGSSYKERRLDPEKISISGTRTYGYIPGNIAIDR